MITRNIRVVADYKYSRVLMGVCATVIWGYISQQDTPAQALTTINTVLLKVAKELDIDLSSTAQIEQLRDEAVNFMKSID